jgi:pimeloyl-ACP methyl ester carboxylesterase
MIMQHTVPATAQTLPRVGCDIHYWPAGPTEGPLVICTHAAGIDHHEWDALVPALADSFRVVIWDVRGHGASRPNTAPFTIRRVTDDLVALLDTLGADTALLVGHSMGGNIIQEVIFQYPERVRAAVLLGCTCNTLPQSRSERLQMRISGPLLRLYPWDTLRRQSAELSAERPEVRAYLYKALGQMTKEEFGTVLIELLRCLHDESGYRIPIPFLLIHGAHDRTGNIRKIAPVWARRDSHCTYVVVPDAGHTANMDNPAFFNRQARDFLRQYEVPR